jgi:hypothetical protein
MPLGLVLSLIGTAAVLVGTGTWAATVQLRVRRLERDVRRLGAAVRAGKWTDGEDI